MLPRVYVPGAGGRDREIELPADEAHHLGRVLRRGSGAEIRVFDGRGREYRARVSSATRQRVWITVLEPVECLALPRVALTLVQAVLKGGAMDEVVRDCTMVGVTAVQPVSSERSVVKAASINRARARWERVAIASARQCGRAALPAIAEPMSLDEWLEAPRPGLTLWLVEPAVAAGALTLRDLAGGSQPEAAALVVGPEGGWTASEREAALAAGCRLLTLGPLTLRAAAVPFAAAAALLALWEAQE